MRKNKLDEMQELKLLAIERTAMWYTFWALFLAVLVQIVLGADLRQIAGEAIVFIALSLYICFRCFIAGIWDRYITPNRKTFLVTGAISVVAFFAIGFLSISGALRRGVKHCYMLALLVFSVLR